MSEISIRRVTLDDIVILAEYNKRLIEDEKHENKMNIERLRERMKDFICGDYKNLSAKEFLQEAFGRAKRLEAFDQELKAKEDQFISMILTIIYSNYILAQYQID